MLYLVLLLLLGLGNNIDIRSASYTKLIGQYNMGQCHPPPPPLLLLQVIVKQHRQYSRLLSHSKAELTHIDIHASHPLCVSKVGRREGLGVCLIPPQFTTITTMFHLPILTNHFPTRSSVYLLIFISWMSSGQHYKEISFKLCWKVGFLGRGRMCSIILKHIQSFIIEER